MVLQSGIEAIELDKYGKGYIATTDLEKGRIILIENAITVNKSSTIESMFDIIKTIISDSILYNRFLKLVPYSLPLNNRLIEYREYKSYKKLYPDIDIALIVNKYIRNAFMFNGCPAVLLEGSIFNHSCEPNTEFYSKNSSMVYKTLKKIKKGEQLFIMYGDITKLNYKERSEKLLKQYGFICQCEKCKNKI